MRRLSTVGAILVAVGALLASLAGPAGTASASPLAPAQGHPGRISVVKISGLLDPVLVHFLGQSIVDAERRKAGWLVLQLNSTGSVVPDAEIALLAHQIAASKVPVAVWVGPSGSQARGGAAQLAGVAAAVGIAPGSRLGDIGDQVISRTLLRSAFVRALDRLRSGTVGASEAQSLGLTARPAPIIGDFIVKLDGVQTRVVKTDHGPRVTTTRASTPVFGALSIGDQLMHTVSSPAVAYLLFVIGMALIVFELFTAGVGVAGLVGAGAVVLGCYGLAVLPLHPVAVVLLVASMVAFAVDVQTGVPRVWTTVGAVAFVIGSFSLYDGLSLSWITLLVSIVGITLFMLAGMPAMVRTRFSTPTIGRAWMVGEEGEAVADVDPDGVVKVRGALWRARTNRATPLTAGAPVRVVEVDGLLLEVEPLEGAARDHRSR